MQYSTSFSCKCGKQNDHTACWHQLHPRYWVPQEEKSLINPPDCVGRVIGSPICVGTEKAVPPPTTNKGVTLV